MVLAAPLFLLFHLISSPFPPLPWTTPSNLTASFLSTLVLLALGEGHAELVRTLLEHGADTEARDNDKQTLLFLVVPVEGEDVEHALIMGTGKCPMAEMRGPSMRIMIHH